MSPAGPGCWVRRDFINRCAGKGHLRPHQFPNPPGPGRCVELGCPQLPASHLKCTRSFLKCRESSACATQAQISLFFSRGLCTRWKIITVLKSLHHQYLHLFVKVSLKILKRTISTHKQLLFREGKNNLKDTVISVRIWFPFFKQLSFWNYEEMSEIIREFLHSQCNQQVIYVVFLSILNSFRKKENHVFVEMHV